MKLESLLLFTKLKFLSTLHLSSFSIKQCVTDCYRQARHPLPRYDAGVMMNRQYYRSAGGREWGYDVPGCAPSAAALIIVIESSHRDNY